MSKAENRAIEKYPIEMYEEVGWRCVDKNAAKRECFIEGYHQAERDLTDKAKTSSGWDGFFYGQGYKQAEKDLELTWEDVKAIFLLVQVEWSPNKNEEEIYQEVLKRFKDFRERKEK